MKNILITGGCGFIGSHTCIQLLKDGNNVCVIDSLINSSEKTILKINKILKLSNYENKGNLIFKKGDLKDKDFLKNVFNDFTETNKTFDAVFHFAGLKSVTESVITPLRYWRENLNITLNLLEIMNDFDCNKLVFSSSASLYAPNDKGIFTESSPRNPINPYGKTKLAIEKILEDLFLSDIKKWKIANLRYFNPVGAHESGLIGENPLITPTNLFPIILKVAKGRIKKLPIYGGDWPTKDGTCIRDYIHIMDLADAHIAALNFLDQNRPQINSFNIGTGTGNSVMEIVRTFKKVNNISVPYEFKKRRIGDPAITIADNRKALKFLNWSPKRNINDMCCDAWRYSNHFE